MKRRVLFLALLALVVLLAEAGERSSGRNGEHSDDASEPETETSPNKSSYEDTTGDHIANLDQDPDTDSVENQDRRTGSKLSDEKRGSHSFQRLGRVKNLIRKLHCQRKCRIKCTSATCGLEPGPNPDPVPQPQPPQPPQPPKPPKPPKPDPPEPEPPQPNTTRVQENIFISENQLEADYNNEDNQLSVPEEARAQIGHMVQLNEAGVLERALRCMQLLSRGLCRLSESKSVPAGDLIRPAERPIFIQMTDIVTRSISLLTKTQNRRLHSKLDRSEWNTSAHLDGEQAKASQSNTGQQQQVVVLNHILDVTRSVMEQMESFEEKNTSKTTSKSSNQCKLQRELEMSEMFKEVVSIADQTVESMYKNSHKPELQLNGEKGEIIEALIKIARRILSTSRKRMNDDDCTTRGLSDRESEWPELAAASEALAAHLYEQPSRDNSQRDENVQENESDNSRVGHLSKLFRPCDCQSLDFCCA